MQRVKRKEKILIQNNHNFQPLHSINNNIPYGNHKRFIKRNILLNRDIIPNRINKFLSFQDRQQLIGDINESKNQLNLYQPPEQKEIKQNSNHENNKNNKTLLYIRKTKSNLNISNKPQNKTRIINARNTIGQQIKFTENKTLINKTIKEYYKNENLFKEYLKNLNIELNETKIKNYHKSLFYINSSSNNKNRNSQDYNNIKEYNNRSNEIYKKPISSKVYNKPNVNCITEENKNYELNNIKKTNLKKIYMNDSAKKEKINCSKMINNNGVKKNIFDMINNYNTKTIKNNSIKDNSNKSNFKKHKHHQTIDECHNKNYSSNFKNININTNLNSNLNILNEINKKEYQNRNNLNEIKTFVGFNTNGNKTCKNKSVNLFKPVYLNEENNNNFYNLNSDSNNIYNQILNQNQNQNQKQKMFYNNINNIKNINNLNNIKNANIKYKKKNILSPSPEYVPKKILFKRNFMSNDLPRLLVEKDLISFTNNNKLPNLDMLNNEKITQSKNNNDDLIISNDNNNNSNYNFYSDRESLIDKAKEILENRINAYINTEVKKDTKNKSFSLSLDKNTKKEIKRNKTFSYISNKDDDNEDNYFYQNGKNIYKYRNGLYKEKNNYYKPNNSLITKEVIFPININNNNSSFYNSDDDIMNSNSNSNLGSNYIKNNNNVKVGIHYSNSFDNVINNIKLNNNNYKPYDNNNKNNIATFSQSPNPTKDYYFNYLSNKINNDFLNENKLKKLDKNKYKSEFLNKNAFCEKCKRNYCPYCCRISPEFDLNENNHINKNFSPLNNYLNNQNNYPKSTIHSKTISVNYESNNLKNNLITNNIERNKSEEEKNNIRKTIVANNVNLKLDDSNGKYNSENINIYQNLNNIQLEGNKLVIIENDKNKDIKDNLYKKENINLINENYKKTNEIKDNDININIGNEIKNKKDSEMDKTEHIKSISEITSSERFIIKGEGISLSNSEFLLNENSNDNTNQKKIKNINISKISKDNEENENKVYKKINDIMQNIEVTPPTKRNSFIKDSSINNNDNNFTKTDIDININNTGIILKNLSIKNELIKKNYINKKNQSESPILSDILECINIITPKNYIIIKNKLINIISNKEKNISISFVNILYPIAINQKNYQPIYAKLFKDIDKIDKSHNKKDKSKTVIRTQLMKFCKSNFKKIKVCLENINYIENDINFIGELINAQMVSKKVGIQCLTHLVDKFNQYNNNEKLVNKKDEKYLYLECIINLFNQFATCVNYYQKNKIRQDELLLFQKETNYYLNIITGIYNNKINADMPNKTRIKLLKIIEKSKNNWDITLYERYKYQLIKDIYEDSNIESINNRNSIITKFDKNIDINNNKKNPDNVKLNKQYKSVSPNNNINIGNYNNKKNKENQILNSNKKNNNNCKKILIGNSKIILNNLIIFKKHINEYESSDTFKNWEEIDNLFLDKKIKKSEIFKSIIEASKYFLENKNDIYYLDIYIKIIFEYYYNYLNKNDINDIANTFLGELGNLTNEEINKEENKYINDIWIIIIYYLLQNKIMIMNDFNYFCNIYNKEIKKNIYTILNGVCAYNIENKQNYLKELYNTKFISMNKKLLHINTEN